MSERSRRLFVALVRGAGSVIDLGGTGRRVVLPPTFTREPIEDVVARDWDIIAEDFNRVAVRRRRLRSEG